jgi:hypothetical protein
MTFIKKYWIEILVIVIIGGILLLDCAPDKTWINTDSDGVHYTYSAQWLYPSHKQSAPLYLLLGYLFIKIPFGTEFWRMALISVISGTIGSIFIMTIIREKLKGIKWSKWYAIIGTLIYGGSALAISQNTIVEAYPLITAIGLATYYLAIKGKWVLSCIVAGLAIAVHPTALLIIIPIFIGFKELRNWRRWIIVLPFFLFYLYTPLTNRPPYMWQPPKGEGNDLAFVNDAVSTVQMLTGTLAIYDLPKRLFDTVGLLLLNFALVGIMPLILAFKNGKGWYKDVLFWLVVVPIIYFSIDLAPQTYVYLQPSIAFGAIAVGIGLNKVGKKIIYATVGCAIILLGINANYFDIGRTLDKNLSAMEFYEIELDKVPDGQILMPYYACAWASIYRYNKENNRDIIPVCMDMLTDPYYQSLLAEQGIKLDDNLSENRIEHQNYIALSVVRLNDNVWTTRTIDAGTYRFEIVRAKGNEDLINRVPIEPAGQWHWKPSNPYDIITGKIEITDWQFVTISNHNVLYTSLVIVILYLLYLSIENRFKKVKSADNA